MVEFKLAIIIPAFNEAKTIGKVVSDALLYGQPIVVDDASQDETSSIASNKGAIIVQHPFNQGYDAALHSGFSKAQLLNFTHVLSLDADGQHDASYIKEYASKLQEGYDIVLGIRPKKARFAEVLFGLYTLLLYRISDPLCGMKAYNLSIYKQPMSFSTYPSIGTELMLYALKNNKKYAQIPIPLRERLDAPRFASAFKANVLILRALLYAILT